MGTTPRCGVSVCVPTPAPVPPSSAGSPSSDSCPGLSNGEEASLEKLSLEPRKSLSEEGPQRGPDLGPADREEEDEDEEEEDQPDPKKPTTDEVRPASGRRALGPPRAGFGHSQTLPAVLEFGGGGGMEGEERP